MILDFFFDLINARKQRLHFTEFMINFHDFVNDRKYMIKDKFVCKRFKSKVSLIYLMNFK